MKSRTLGTILLASSIAITAGCRKETAKTTSPEKTTSQAETTTDPPTRASEGFAKTIMTELEKHNEPNFIPTIGFPHQNGFTKFGLCKDDGEVPNGITVTTIRGTQDRVIESLVIDREPCGGETPGKEDMVLMRVIPKGGAPDAFGMASPGLRDAVWETYRDDGTTMAEGIEADLLKTKNEER